MKKESLSLPGNKLLSENGLIVVESAVETVFTKMDKLGYEISNVKEYKTNKFTFIRK